jgi:AcrR family transcriptional regulator
MSAVLLSEPESRTVRKARETRQRILQAALDLFTERGVDAVTVEEIADRADYARGTVFNHFSTKDSLCHALGEVQTERLLQAVECGEIAGPRASDKIEQALRLMAEFPTSNPERCRELLVKVLSIWKSGEVPEHRRRIFQLIETWVLEGQAAGEFRRDQASCTLAGLIMGLNLQTTLLWSYGLLPGTLAEHTTSAFRLAFEGLSAACAVTRE